MGTLLSKQGEREMQRNQQPSANRQRLDLAGFAQEFLRRNPRYRADYGKIAHGDTSPRSIAAQESMAHRWGLSFPFSA